MEWVVHQGGSHYKSHRTVDGIPSDGHCFARWLEIEICTGKYKGDIFYLLEIYNSSSKSPLTSLDFSPISCCCCCL